MNALRPQRQLDQGGGMHELPGLEARNVRPRGPVALCRHYGTEDQNPPTRPDKAVGDHVGNVTPKEKHTDNSQLWAENVDNWYKGLSTYTHPLYYTNEIQTEKQLVNTTVGIKTKQNNIETTSMESKFHSENAGASHDNNCGDGGLKDDLEINVMSRIPEPNRLKESRGFRDVRRYDDGLNRVGNSKHDYDDCDIDLRKKYRKQVGDNLVVPTPSDLNPRNIRRMTIGQIALPQTPDTFYIDTDKNTTSINSIDMQESCNSIIEKEDTPPGDNQVDGPSGPSASPNNATDDTNADKSNQSLDQPANDCIPCDEVEDISWLTTPTLDSDNHSPGKDIELTEVKPKNLNIYSVENLNISNIEELDISNLENLTICDIEGSYEQFMLNQQVFLQSIEGDGNSITYISQDCKNENQIETLAVSEPVSYNTNKDTDTSVQTILSACPEPTCGEHDCRADSHRKPQDEQNTTNDQIVLAQLPNNAYIFLTLPQPLTSHNNVNISVQPLQIENSKDVNPIVSKSNNKSNNTKKKKQKASGGTSEQAVSSDAKKSALDKNILKVLLFENLFNNNVNENISHTSEVPAITSKEVDSAISFSCITTPEVVSSCNTTSSTAQSAVAVDPKPLQLGSDYRAVSSLVGAAPPSAPPPAPPSAPPPAPALPPALPQPRSVISSSFNGLPLSRPNYGATANSAPEEYKKSLDENGNSVQGFSSPLSGSSQHKKPRRKKSSKNETVIDCQQIDGYQGDKDVNELLRFIESNADNGRGPKLGRVKHKDDSDDKSGKKRSTERRKDKENKIKRATSMEELSRTKIEDLTDATESPLRSDKKERRSDVPNKAERRSWGDDARDSILYNDHPTDSPVAAAELTDFQTVTKKRKPRRRTDEPEPAPRRTRPPSPRPRRESAPPSDRSNDSNDDMDSVHSLPSATPAPPAAPPPTQASYADIARTRHNIPDLIESCNFYGDGAAPPATAPADADGYPALDARQAARRRDKAPPLRRKERAAPPADSAAAEAPAPDVVADRRPAVILLDSGARPRDMDGVTFGFELNEQLLGGGARRPRCELALGALARPRCDLVRDAADAVAVRAGLSALRYVPPATAPDAAALLQIVDYVGAAWDDVLRCGAGKVRYYSE
ncbi:uncharacterized protein LOC118274689 isoform X3 [Spodoptera frugiperda]|uniref:Uncharacterized protein LOC118274689 isoform X1 n=1 Tax=Spodoptera frugiperda TaxID=7108 RepID=A0A9R0DU27_SPOFR|nr:uncharacterized protein LOC118274689 isoform X1 [Spodoptera frugiperda]XP_050552841.1 uncharacterized protein LOC118274689 isoform X2 [Spodoptera frugiperda]XP_050552842.1 uncharacterized protein LOC118274689 isoform X3 [Spodoptera frugiperda]